MSAFNETDVHPTGVQGVYAGVQNTTEPSDQQKDVFTTGGDVSGQTGVASEEGYKHPIAAPGHEQSVVEAKEGLIESTELAPLGDEKVAADPGFGSQAISAVKAAYNAVAGEQ
ncbi:hypothetical protein IAU60_004016 [Kwoniella sp. DSM 27419]